MPKKKTITKKKSEPQENNWWRKYTTEYQDENLEKNVSQKSTGSSVQKIEQPKKSIVHFNGSDKLPDMSGVAKEMEGMVRGLLKSNLFGKNILYLLLIFFNSEPKRPLPPVMTILFL